MSLQRVYSSIDSATNVEETVPSQPGTVKSSDVPPVYANNIIRRPSFKAQLIPTNIGEADPKNTKYSSIFNNRCQLLPNVIGEVSSNPQHQNKVYIRECSFQGKSALIHYFKGSDGEKKFENAIQALQFPLLKSRNNRIVEYFDAVQLKKPTSADNGFKFIMITSFYEPSQSLASLYRFKDEQIVDVLDETFIVYTVYSLLLAVRDLHAAGYVHRGLSEHSFYAESTAPTTDWILADFDEAGLVSATYSVPPSKCEYYDTLYDGKTYEYASDIFALGILLFKVISGGQSINLGTNSDYSDRIEQHIQGKEFSNQYRSLLNSTLCNSPYTIRLTAQQLVDLWESRFDFGHSH
ncbi:uncharacterized protein EV154DRAFT_229338 [Mucor mucedo]|uniref:uncharacterized protein n=1 Tax=Mucor mucedo TaxID=29922 RepID=UPI00221E4E0C|nr:uncharacterized protein EV154DRAFT_229338 [Mucor mucedo]KAI7891248.1 hypothetical protein EV154DRAFT_229338 [Mucor mucedo]